MNNELAQSILDNIKTSGSASADDIKNIIVSDSLQAVTHSSGAGRIKQTIAKNAKLILSQPKALLTFSSLQVRCCLCKKVISYPAWYYSIKYAVNHFHYFICFDSNDTSKPTVSCYKRSI